MRLEVLSAVWMRIQVPNEVMLHHSMSCSRTFEAMWCLSLVRVSGAHALPDSLQPISLSVHVISSLCAMVFTYHNSNLQINVGNIISILLYT